MHRKALAIRRELAAAFGADAASRLDLVRSVHRVGFMLHLTGDNAAALAAYEEARQLAEGLEVDAPTDEVRSILASICSNIGRLLYDTGKPAEALAAHEKAVAIRREAGRFPNRRPRDQELDQSSSYNEIGHVLRSIGRAKWRLWKRTATHWRSPRGWAMPTPPSPGSRCTWPGPTTISVSVQSRSGKPSEALEAQSKALAIRQRLVDASPAVIQFQGDLGWCHEEEAGGGSGGQHRAESQAIRLIATTEGRDADARSVV